VSIVTLIIIHIDNTETRGMVMPENDFISKNMSIHVITLQPSVNEGEDETSFTQEQNDVDAQEVDATTRRRFVFGDRFVTTTMPSSPATTPITLQSIIKLFSNAPPQQQHPPKISISLNPAQFFKLQLLNDTKKFEEHFKLKDAVPTLVDASQLPLHDNRCMPLLGSCRLGIKWTKFGERRYCVDVDRSLCER
jgi:hypothetical protein